MKKDDESKMKCKLQELEDMDIKKAVTIIVEAAPFDEIFNSDNHSFQGRWRSYIQYKLNMFDIYL